MSAGWILVFFVEDWVINFSCFHSVKLVFLKLIFNVDNIFLIETI